MTMESRQPEGTGPNADLVRSAALSSADLWHEILERLNEVQEGQLRLARAIESLGMIVCDALSVNPQSALSGAEQTSLARPSPRVQLAAGPPAQPNVTSDPAATRARHRLSPLQRRFHHGITRPRGAEDARSPRARHHRVGRLAAFLRRPRFRGEPQGHTSAGRKRIVAPRPPRRSRARPRSTRHAHARHRAQPHTGRHRCSPGRRIRRGALRFESARTGRARHRGGCTADHAAGNRIRRRHDGLARNHGQSVALSTAGSVGDAVATARATHVTETLFVDAGASAPGHVGRIPDRSPESITGRHATPEHRVVGHHRSPPAGRGAHTCGQGASSAICRAALDPEVHVLKLHSAFCNAFQLPGVPGPGCPRASLHTRKNFLA